MEPVNVSNRPALTTTESSHAVFLTYTLQRPSWDKPSLSFLQQLKFSQSKTKCLRTKGLIPGFPSPLPRVLAGSALLVAATSRQPAVNPRARVCAGWVQVAMLANVWAATHSCVINVIYLIQTSWLIWLVTWPSCCLQLLHFTAVWLSSDDS